MSKLERLTVGDLLINNNFYNTNFDRDDCWHSKDLKFANYTQMIEIFDIGSVLPQSADCLDVGCGTGDFPKMLREMQVRNYLGVDIFNRHLELARKKYPNNQFLLADILSDPLVSKFDFVFCSGGLSSVLESDNYQFIEAMITKMWNLAKVGVAFNFLIPEVDGLDGKWGSAFVYDPVEISNICFGIASNGCFILEKDDEGQAHVKLLKEKPRGTISHLDKFKNIPRK